jgi:hypothetical protein
MNPLANTREAEGAAEDRQEAAAESDSPGEAAAASTRDASTSRDPKLEASFAIHFFPAANQYYLLMYR